VTKSSRLHRHPAHMYTELIGLRGVLKECKYEIQPLFVKTNTLGQEPVAHVCNPSYSGCRNQKDPGLSQLKQIVCNILS
jgi:hypothetical protein